jgi:hypothetical protein
VYDKDQCRFKRCLSLLVFFSGRRLLNIISSSLFVKMYRGREYGCTKCFAQKSSCTGVPAVGMTKCVVLKMKSMTLIFLAYDFSPFPAELLVVTFEI